MRKTILFFIILSLNFSCIRKTEKDYVFSDIKNTLKDIRINSLTCDTLVLNPKFSSYNGFLEIVNDEIYFFDRIFCNVYIFSKDGILKSKVLGKGKGPGEVLSFDYHANIPTGGHFFIDGFWNCYVFNNEWTREKMYRIDWNITNSKRELLKNPKPEMNGLYEIEYMIESIKFVDNKHLLIPIVSDHPKWNSYTSEDYYKNVRILAKLDIKSGKIVGTYGRKSREYLKYHYLPNFNYFDFDTSSENIYISHEIDTCIHVLSLSFKHLYSFGRKGRDMNTDYKETHRFKEAEESLYENRKIFGYYNFIKYIKETRLLFRGYEKGNQSKFNGLQIYDKNTLIADLDVPKQFKIIGYIKPYYFAQGIIDEENEMVRIYRFKLN